MQIFSALLFLFFSLWVNFAHADFGCHFLLNQILYQALEQPENKISFRFTCQEDMNLIAVSFHVGDAKSPPSYLVTLHDDEKGSPVSQTLASAALTPKDHSWATVPIDNLPLEKGKVYHLVIEQDAFRGGMHKVGKIGPENFASIDYGDALNPFDPRNETSDPNLNVLIFKKGKWKTLNRQPLYALHGTGARLQGNPYDEAGELPIYAGGSPENPTPGLSQGEALHPHYGLTGTGLALRVRKVGHPAHPLNYSVYIIDFMRHKTIPSFHGEALKPDQVPASFQWVTFGFNPKDHPQSFPPQGQCVVFQTESGQATPDPPGCADCYVISEVGNSGGLASAADLSFDGGAHLSREVRSSDGWSDWTDAFERDANVIILGPTQEPLGEPNPGAIPTPDLWFQGIAP